MASLLVKCINTSSVLFTVSMGKARYPASVSKGTLMSFSIFI